jgi:hypothetical protein
MTGLESEKSSASSIGVDRDSKPDAIGSIVAMQEILEDIEYLSDKAFKYARGKYSVNINQKINEIRSKYGLPKQML